jgi:hypothetical protein
MSGDSAVVVRAGGGEPHHRLLACESCTVVVGTLCGGVVAVREKGGARSSADVADSSGESERVGCRCSNGKRVPDPHKCRSPKSAHYLTIVKTLRTTTAPSALTHATRRLCVGSDGPLTRSIKEHQ